MGKSVAASSYVCNPLTIVVDDTCPVVNKLSWLVRQWDKASTFRFVGSDTTGADADLLLEQLSETPWSLMLIDEQGHTWVGPEAIPFILKNLPSGKIAAVTYTIPGTMWLTRKLYLLVSRNRRLLRNNPGSGSTYKAA